MQIKIIFAQKYISFSFRYFLTSIKSNVAITKSDPQETLSSNCVAHKMCQKT